MACDFETAKNARLRFPQEMQEQIKEWTEYNFPDARSYQPLLGAVEELGELAHAHLKCEQGIRDGLWTLKKSDAIGDIVVFLIHYCILQGIDFWESCIGAWCVARERDWIQFPKNGRTE